MLVDVLAAGGTKVRDLIVRQRYSDLLRHAPIHIANAARSRQRQDRGRATALHSHCQARQLLVFIGNVVQFFAGFFVAQAPCYGPHFVRTSEVYGDCCLSVVHLVHLQIVCEDLEKTNGGAAVRYCIGDGLLGSRAAAYQAICGRGKATRL